MYSDASLSGVGGKFGPCEFFNTLATDHDGDLRLAVIVRVTRHAPSEADQPGFERTDVSRFHGGGLQDELAALIALACGIRVEAGGIVREFRGDDPLGRPIQHSHREPLLPPARHRLIRRLRDGSLNDLGRVLNRYVDSGPSDSIEILRAARMYQQAVWMCDADPDYAWLRFVSALETAATCWARDGTDDVTALRSAKPELAAKLREFGDDHELEIARLLRDQLRATSRFLSFTERYRPDPPDERPELAFQLDWRNLKRTMRTIYEYRSQSLHAGVPFPRPMSLPPLRTHMGELCAEAPPGLASGFGASRWIAKDTPMYLHTFEHITRHTLLSWLADPER